MPRKFCILFTYCLTISLLVFDSRTFAKPDPAGPPQQIYKTVGERKLTLEFDYPPGWKPSDKRPAIVFFFGGGWTHGSPNQFKAQAQYFAKRGLVCARADYRIRSRDNVAPDKCVEDAFSAMRWVRKHAAECGIDPDRIVAAGGSAGGHLAACTFLCDGINASDDDKSTSPKPNAMILYNPVLDVVAVRDERSVRGGNYFKGVDDKTLKQISPAQYLRKETPPTLIIDGTKDWLYPQTHAFAEKAKSIGAPVEAWYAEGQPHGFFNKPPWVEKTTAEADAFLVRIGYLNVEPKVTLPASAGRR
jgi:acetyl esterase